MKKFLAFATLASAALVGCVNDEAMEVTSEAQKLSFDTPVMSTQTRADHKGEIVGTTYPSEEEFVVYAKQHSGNLETWAAASPFWSTDDDPITVTQKAASDWEHESTVYYWPKASDENIKLSFAAYSPAELGTANTNATVNYGATGLTIDGFTVENTVADQIDLMYSERILNQQQTGITSTAVPVVFKHALSSIVFSAVENDDAATYKITSIKVDGLFATSGKFEETVTDGASYSANPKWTPAAGTNTTYTPAATCTFDVPVTTAANLTGEGTTLGRTSAILPIPQDVPEGATVTITYERTATDGAKQYTATKQLKEFTNGTTTIESWVMGYRYNYQFQFGGTPKIFFSPSVTDWENGGTVSVAI